MNFDTLKSGAVSFIAAQRIPGRPQGAYRNGPQGAEQLIASTDFCMALDHFGALAPLAAAEKDEWAAYLNGFQTEEGYYWQTGLEFRDLSSPMHRWDYLMGYFTRHALWALNLLERPPRRPLRFCDRFVDRNFLKGWLKDRHWANIWHAANEFLMAYAWLQARHVWFQDAQAREAMAALAEFLRPYLDPQTGYWGTQHGSTVANALGGYIHITPIYWDLGLEVPSVQAAIDSTLGLLRPDGFFMGAAPYDYDGVYTLANLTTLTTHRRAEIQTALGKAEQACQTMRNPDGGFKDNNFTAWGVAPDFTTPKGASGSTGTWMYTAALGLGAMVLEHSPLKGPWSFSPRVGHLVCAPTFPRSS